LLDRIYSQLIIYNYTYSINAIVIVF